MVDPADLPLQWKTAARLPAGCTQPMRTLKESGMKETELANTLTSVVDEEVNDVWGAIEHKPEEAMASSHVTTRMAEDGDQMKAVMTKADRDAKEKGKRRERKKKRARPRSFGKTC